MPQSMIVACTGAQEVPQEFFAVRDNVFWDGGWRGQLIFSTGERRRMRTGRWCRRGATHTCHTEVKVDEQTCHVRGWLNFRLSGNTARGRKRKWRMFCRVLAHSPPWPLSRNEKPKEEKKDRMNDKSHTQILAHKASCRCIWGFSA